MLAEGEPRWTAGCWAKARLAANKATNASVRGSFMPQLGRPRPDRQADSKPPGRRGCIPLSCRCVTLICARSATPAVRRPRVGREAFGVRRRVGAFCRARPQSGDPSPHSTRCATFTASGSALWPSVESRFWGSLQETEMRSGAPGARGGLPAQPLEPANTRRPVALRHGGPRRPLTGEFGGRPARRSITAGPAVRASSKSAPRTSFRR